MSNLLSNSELELLALAKQINTVGEQLEVLLYDFLKLSANYNEGYERNLSITPYAVNLPCCTCSQVDNRLNLELKSRGLGETIPFNTELNSTLNTVNEDKIYALQEWLYHLKSQRNYPGVSPALDSQIEEAARRVIAAGGNPNEFIVKNKTTNTWKWIKKTLEPGRMD